MTEFGAEANRDGPVEEKGTWAAQRAFVRYHLGVYATKPWLSGVAYWALNEFRVHPVWEGGNPRPQPPVHQKGLLRYGTWERKPAWSDVRRSFTRTRQFGRRAGARRGDRGGWTRRAGGSVAPGGPADRSRRMGGPAGGHGRGRRATSRGRAARREDCSASGSGTPPVGRGLGRDGRRSLPPPPPPSSSSGGFHALVGSERRNM